MGDRAARRGGTGPATCEDEEDMRFDPSNDSAVHDSPPTPFPREQRAPSTAVAVNPAELTRILGGVVDGITAQDARGRLVYADAGAARAMGYPTAAALLAAPSRELFASLDLLDEHGRPMPIDQLPGQRVLRGAADAEAVVGWREHATGQERWSIVKAVPVQNDDGSLRMVINVFREITERVRRDRAREETSRLLADAWAALADSLDLRTTLATLAELVTPARADFCIISTLEPDGALRHVISAGVREEALVRDLLDRYPETPEAPPGVPAALRTGRAVSFLDIPPGAAQRGAVDDEHAELLEALGTRSLIIAPLVARGRALGTITLAYTGSGRRYATEDVGVAEELARRAALAIDNARLYAAEQDARRRAETAARRTERLQTITSALAAADTVEEIGDVIMRHGVAALGAYAGVLALLSDGGVELEILASTGYDPAACMGRGRRWPAGARIPIADATRGRVPVLVPSREAWAERYTPGRVPGGRSAAWAAFPLEAGEGVVGALLWTYEQAHTFDADDREFLLAIARQCGSALERARLHEAERQARAEAETANRAKSEFLATMSHELRTPLTAVIGYEELIADGISGPTTDAQRAYLGRIKASALHLLGLIDEILTFSRLEAGREILHPEALDVEAMLREAASIIEPMLSGRPIALRVEPPRGPVIIVSDGGKLRQVLLNLLSNAVKFTHRGEIVLGAERDGADVVFHVSDTGIGIAPEHIDRIFDAFWQAEQRATRKFGGTGLGLSVTRRLAHLLGGEVKVTSTPGAGSTFSVRVPVIRGVESSG